ncbi:hypothetical protein AB205_0018140 [Aquarana catesbeiana]|uniref:Uncharacterized protein n=1 Tax=Aquarana catesbeiana TaxID=8400 RepID=A0A2G9S603_AQUCT|nr:hypothetical protein AB205_0018140 [Aquarana catesbeiana]
MFAYILTAAYTLSPVRQSLTLKARWRIKLPQGKRTCCEKAFLAEENFIIVILFHETATNLHSSLFCSYTVHCPYSPYQNHCCIQSVAPIPDNSKLLP